MNEIIMVIVPDTISDFNSDSEMHMPALHNEHCNRSKFFTVTYSYYSRPRAHTCVIRALATEVKAALYYHLNDILWNGDGNYNTLG